MHPIKPILTVFHESAGLRTREEPRASARAVSGTVKGRRVARVLTGMAAGVVLCIAPGIAAAAGPLSELPEPGGYMSWVRIVLILVCQIPWLVFCQWVDKDTRLVKRMNREMWNGIVLAGGIVGLVVWLFLPWTSAGLFAAGFGLWFVITTGTCSVYVILRNGMVDVGSRVFTPRHIKGVLASFGKKEERMQAVERVRLIAHDGQKVPVPEDPNKMDEYEAAQALLFDALWRRATEVEMLVATNAVKLVYRIDGVPTARHDLLPRDTADKALLLIKTLAGLDIHERRRPQTGSLRGAVSGSDAGMTEVEVRSSGTTQHARLSLKIIGDQNRLRIPDLGMEEKQQAQLEAIAARPKGLVVVSGPRAGGVTTTLYALLRSHDAFMQNLLTLEYAPLMELENITQHVYDSGKHEASYARQLQTVLRREPDVVMVSDCADRETAHLAAKAARDGKKIYVGMIARDGFDALKKLISLAGDTDTVADTLLGVVSQRLTRKLCIACRQAYKPDEQLLQKANLPVAKIEHFYRPPPEGLVDAKGNPIICTNCQGSGYFGRTGVFELLEMDDGIRDLIRHGQAVNAVRAQARKNGMLYLQEVGLQKVIQGATSMNEILRILRDEEASGGGKQPSGARSPKGPSAPHRAAGAAAQPPGADPRAQKGG